MNLRSAVVLSLVGVAVSLGAAWCVEGCKPPVAQQAELTYGAELAACTAAAKARYPHDHDAGRADSEACEADVDRRWHVVTDGGSHDGG